MTDVASPRSPGRPRRDARTVLRAGCALLLLALTACSGGPAGQGGGATQRSRTASAAAIAVPGERRVALVIGNGAYDTAPLPNALRDAEGMADTLRALGFELEGGGARLNLGQREIQDALRDFGRSLEAPSDGRTVAAFFYYAGHAIQREGVNYLAPVGARVQTDRDVAREMVSIDEVMREIGSTDGVRIVVLDACRNDPFAAGAARGFRVVGLAPQEAPTGTVVAYSTAPGQAAADGVDGEEHSPYTAALIDALSQDGLRLEDVFMEVRNTVDRRTGGSQVPWEHSSLRWPFYFRPARSEAESLEARCRGGRDAAACHLLGRRAESEAKPYDALALYSHGCEARHPASCVDFTRLRFRMGMNEPLEEARARVEAACEAGYAPGCTSLARSFEHGPPGARDLARAAQLYERGCVEGDGHGCAGLGGLYMRGAGVVRDGARAMTLLTRACDQGVQDGCASVGYLYAEGLGAPRDYARARALFEEACARGSMTACSNLGFLHENARGVAQDFGRARELYEQACSGGEPLGCSNLGVLFSAGRGVAQDLERARELYGAACEGGHANGCRNLGVLFDEGRGVPQDPARAAEFFAAACEGGDVLGCSSLGLLYANGRGVAQDDASARTLYERACEGGDAVGCTNLGLFYSVGRDVPRDLARSAQLYERACEGGNLIGCGNLASLYELGQGVTRDLARARQLYDGVCAAAPERCLSLAAMLLEGLGGPPDERRGVALMQAECARSGSLVACTQAALRSGAWPEGTWHRAFRLVVSRAEGTRAGATACELSVAHDGRACALSARCGDAYVYPTISWAAAELDAAGELVACRDTSDSATDGDPALAFDVATGALSAWDRGGRYGDFRLEAAAPARR